MPKSQSVNASPKSSAAPPRPYAPDASLSGGNGSQMPETDGERISRLETVVEQLRHEQDVQLRRIAELQAQLDRQTPRTPER